MAAGTRITALSVIGGGSQSRFWTQIVASGLGVPLTRYHGGEKGPAFGAARLARLAITGETASAVCTKPTVDDVIAPDTGMAALYAERLLRFREFYRRLKSAF